MDKSQEILSELTTWMKYAKFIPEKQRRESWIELVDRNKTMHLKKYPLLADDIEIAYKLVYDKKILPSMRSFQFAGKPVELNPARIYNCSYQPINDYRAFSEAMFLLLSGVGFGFSVQTHHVDCLPEIKRPTKDRRFLIGDSIEGWSDAIKALIKSYLIGGPRPRFDFGDIRQKGALLITSGGKAPGPEPLKICLTHIEAILNSKESGEKLRPIDCHDILCHIADAVLSGGIRRSAMISLFSFDDEEMISCKYGNWWELNPQRGRSNNSAVVVSSRIQQDEFFKLWKKIELSNSGEPGIYFTNDPEYGTNPCVETSLRPHTFCNLVEINGSDIESQDDFNYRCKMATFINTLQASYTDFHYLRSIWKKNTEKDSLIGVGITGIGSNKLNSLDLKESADIVKQENIRVAKILGINKAARTTVIKPSGTTSCVLGTSSGIHAWHNEHYIRRLRVGKNESIYNFLKIYHPELIEDEYFRPTEIAVISIPQKAPEGSIYRTESALDLLERVKRFNVEWVRNGHNSGPNYHNVSATISVDASKWYYKENGHWTLIGLNAVPNLQNEWEVVGEWMWANKGSFHGLSVLPYDGGSYIQAPFEDISESQYHDMVAQLHSIDLNNIVEINDNTNLQGELACAGDSCELK